MILTSFGAIWGVRLPLLDVCIWITTFNSQHWSYPSNICNVFWSSFILELIWHSYWIYCYTRWKNTSSVLSLLPDHFCVFPYCFLVKNKVCWYLIHLFSTIPVIMDVCQASGSHLLFRLHSPALFSICAPQVIHNPERYFNLFEAIAHSTISSERWPRVLSSLLPFHGLETLLTAQGLLAATSSLWFFDKSTICSCRICSNGDVNGDRCLLWHL